MKSLQERWMNNQANSRNNSISSEADIPSNNNTKSNQHQSSSSQQNRSHSRKCSSSESSSSPSPSRNETVLSQSAMSKSQASAIKSFPATQRPPLKNPQLQSPQRAGKFDDIKANNSTRSSAKSPPSRNLQSYTDESVYSIMNVFKTGDNLSFQERSSKVRSILDNLIQQAKSTVQNESNNISNNNSSIINNQREERSLSNSKIKQSSLGCKQEQNNKTIQLLESKLLECEREKTILRKENESSSLRIQLLNKEIEGIKVTSGVINILRESQSLLERNNNTLHEQLKLSEQKNKDQQTIFQSELEEVRSIINHLKQELAHAYQFQ